MSGIPRVVLAGTQYVRNTFFDPTKGELYQVKGRMWSYLRDILRSSGLELITADMVDEASTDPRGLLLVSHGHSRLMQQLIDRGARPVVLLSLEAPLIEHDLYHSLRRLSRLYASVLMFPGARERVDPACSFIPLHDPQPERAVREGNPPWGARRYATTIVANKFQRPASLVNLVAALVERYASRKPQALKTSLRAQVTGLLDPALGRELYSERLRAILYFGRSDDFDLYGIGWDQRGVYSVPERERLVALRRWLGVIDERVATLRNYRFCICFEGARFPGFITEKIFAPMLAGSIPIYYGAPDIERYVPPEAFIDRGHFRDYRELDSYMRSISPAQARRYLDAAAAFMASEAFDPFYYTNVALDIARPIWAAAGLTER